MSAAGAVLTDLENTNPSPARVASATFCAQLRPLSATTTARSEPCLAFAALTKGARVLQSGVFPSKRSKSSGIPSLSSMRPICTMGRGRCSLEQPRFLRPSSSSRSVSKK